MLLDFRAFGGNVCLLVLAFTTFGLGNRNLNCAAGTRPCTVTCVHMQNEPLAIYLFSYFPTCVMA